MERLDKDKCCEVVGFFFDAHVKLLKEASEKFPGIDPALVITASYLAVRELTQHIVSKDANVKSFIKEMGEVHDNLSLKL